MRSLLRGALRDFSAYHSDELSRSKNLTSIQTKGVKGGRAYLPWAFTESGIYMLMTVLKGDLATRQSKALIRTFRAMKDYIVDNNDLLRQHDLLQLSLKISDSNDKLTETNERLTKTDEKLNKTVDTVQIIRVELVHDKLLDIDVVEKTLKTWLRISQSIPKMFSKAVGQTVF